MISLFKRTVLLLLMLVAAPALAQTSGPQTTGPGYVLGPDDAIVVTVYGQPEFGITTRIKADGTIVMPLIGAVKAEGTTNITLAKQLTDKLTSGGYLKAPIINIEISGYLSRSVNIAGRVSNPGIFPIERPSRALDMLLRAGWIRENGANYVYLRRAGQPEVRLGVEGLVRGDDKENPPLMPGDTLFVPDADTFFIYGQIVQPGMKPILPDMTIRQAIALSGGVTPTGKADKVGLVRGKAKEIDVDPSMPVQKGDVIVIKERLF
ncbi:polysaccharide biosynthesis/export family protein [Sandarakinorhabdus sp.]|uniref:polysaccharide biosynthesis/export family protein n=1 Tax=Sandarakinorhabdus sp. TaxID=1916663 RepID=UPI00286E7604|nr:polysaccharide biosynthesis/export family protein [Sandarakinorhabdus sp.]